LKLSSAGLAASAAAALPAFAAAPQKADSPILSPVLFDVRAFGATGDGKTVDSPAINRAIEAAAAAGGGTVVFPAGNYVSFSIRLKSHVDLYLSQGSAIIAAESPLRGQTTGYMGGTYDAADEPKTEWVQYQDWGHNHWHNSLLWGDGIGNFSITGPALIWGKGLSFGADRPAHGGYPKYVAEQPGVGYCAAAYPRSRIHLISRSGHTLNCGFPTPSPDPCAPCWKMCISAGTPAFTSAE
jgi:polygalacturonase